MTRLFLLMVSFVIVVGFTSCGSSQTSQELNSGIELENMDSSVRPQDDFYRFVNGTWLKDTQIPDDSSSYSVFKQIDDKTQLLLKEIVEDASKETSASLGSDEKKIGDLYNSYMDEASLNAKGIDPLKDSLEEIEAIANREDLVKLMAKLYTKGSVIPISWDIWGDSNNSTQNISYIFQDGLGLPDRDYYLSKDEKFVKIITQYQTYISDIMKLARYDNHAKISVDILLLENQLAKAHWSNEQNRDTLKTYNKLDTDEVDVLLGSFDFKIFTQASKLGDAPSFIISQPSYLQEFGIIFKNQSLDTWKEYLAFHLINSYAHLLSKEFVDVKFDFYKNKLKGIEMQKDRWEYAVGSVDEILGEMLGKIYVEKHFPAQAKEQMSTMVENLIKSFDDSIENLTWMSDSTKVSAREKLHKITTKIAYPDIWKDYSKLEIDADDLVGNYFRANEFYYDNTAAKLGVEVDRTQWYMTPQTVNAYYDPNTNEIVFPAAILQAPFFDMDANSAVNYGAIGAVIGHELSHAFDDNGAKYDGDGNLNNWWSEEDSKAFKALGDKLSAQYSSYEPLDGSFINGNLTLGENIADLSGVNISYNAFVASLGSKDAIEIDSFSAKQRFFIGWAQVWRINMREEELRDRLITDPHSPGEYRVFGVLRNMPEFYEAFDVKDGDKMYMQEQHRVKIW